MQLQHRWFKQKQAWTTVNIALIKLIEPIQSLENYNSEWTLVKNKRHKKQINQVKPDLEALMHQMIVLLNTNHPTENQPFNKFQSDHHEVVPFGSIYQNYLINSATTCHVTHNYCGVQDLRLSSSEIIIRNSCKCITKHKGNFLL